MKVTFITPTPPDINAFGVRTLSAVLRKEGFETGIIFLPGGIENLRTDGSYIYKYPEKTLRKIADLCRGSDLVGFSFMSLYYDRAAQISEYVRRELGVPVVWGGIHPTYRPDECLRETDIVCLGEGERAMVDLARKISEGRDFTDVQNCWFKTGQGVRKNPEGPIIDELDSLPFVDYDLVDHHVYDWRTAEVLKIDDEVMKGQFLKLPYFGDRHLLSYRTMTSRGCPHRCSYCASSAMMRLRRRSVDNVMEELEYILARFGYIEIISFFDDTFFAAPIDYFEEFRDKYKKKIGLPFHAQCSPSTMSERKMDLLVDAGLYYTEMGVQTGSDRVKRMYRRIESNEKIVAAAGVIDRYSDRMLTPEYHIILDNPWETAEDAADTLDLLLALPGRFNLQISSLVLFPGTELNERARKEGLLKDELNEVCRKPFLRPRATYLNFLIFLSGFPVVPRRLLRLAASKGLVRLFHSQSHSAFYNLLFVLSRKVRLAAKGLAALAKGDFGRIANYFRLAR